MRDRAIGAITSAIFEALPRLSMLVHRGLLGECSGGHLRAFWLRGAGFYIDSLAEHPTAARMSCSGKWLKDLSLRFLSV